MEIRTHVRENRLTRKPRPKALDFTFLLMAALCLGTFGYLTGFGHGDEWMPASGEAVFQRHEYWRAWSTLFAHADLGHLLSNLFLFIPFSYFLLGYFSKAFFPLLGFLLGGIANMLVLATMPPQVFLVGVSGVVYWMGAAWLTLFLLINKQDPPKRRWGKVIITTTALFVPEAYRPEISYLCHLLGFVFGAASGAALYLVQRRAILAAVVKEEILIPAPEWENEVLEGSNQ